jgi:hypothetical protein
MNEEKISIKEKELVLARLATTSPELHFSIGSDDKSWSRNEMIQEIENESSIGKEFVEIEMNFMRALKTGQVMNVLTAA